MKGRAPEDRAWVNGKVFTGAGFAEALLVEDGVVRAVGTRSEILRAKGTATELTDLRDRLIIPGLVDLHMHLTATSWQRYGVDLRGVRSVGEILERVRSGLERAPRGPVIGFGWDQENLAERRYPTREDLDRIAAGRPVALYRVCHHAAVLNSAALELLGVADPIADPPGGQYGRSSDGRINGVLFDTALDGLDRIVSDFARADPDALGRTLDHAASLGLTTLAPLTATPEEIRAVAHLAERGPLATRVRFYLDLRALDAVPTVPAPPDGADWRLTGVKAIADGSLGARTAWMNEEYADARGVTGFPLWPEEQLITALQTARELRLVPAVHAIGDRALARVLQMLRRAGSNGTPRIEHASVVPPSELDALVELRPNVVIQPHFVVTDWWVPQRLGPERTRWTYPFRTLWDRSLLLGGSSDSPVEPLDPWTGLRAAVFRAPASAFGQATAQERLAPIEAFQLYTRNAGAILGEPELGQLAPGHPADFLVLDVPSLDGALAAARVPVAETWRAGRRVAAPASA